MTVHNRTLTALAAMCLILVLACTTMIQPVIAAEDSEILYWVAPMDPNYRRDKPGKSPMGMDLVPVYAGDDKGGSSVSISPSVVQNLGVRTARSELGRLWRGIDTVGYVDFDESKISHIHLRTAGWIENLAVRSEGERVKQGERLFDVYSPELVNAQEEFVTALNTGNKGLITASKKKLLSLGVSNKQVRGLESNKQVRQRISVYAPQNGIVSTLPVREGMYVKPAKRVMSLADLSSIWLLAEVFERQTDWVAVGQPVEVNLTYLPGRTWEGEVEYIYPSLDEKTRTLKVRLRFDNPGETLKPNMYANVKIYGGARDDIVFIPIEGLIRTGRSERVIIALDRNGDEDHQFEAREVVSGIESGGYIEISDGLSAGEKIVTSGQFLIDSEASMRASMSRMSPADPSMQDSEAAPKAVTGTGIVRILKPTDSKINLQHAPIEELGWPAMTMDFSLAEGVDTSDLKADEEVMFQLEERDERYIITSIHKTGDM